ncbi:LpqN/LpqT family lipoprotein [Nocardia terpenica]|uniref:Uncharacterized protein n=1 Tax=Nocardia terpenica TaxID=455432 RepID=A0A164H2Y2_9NOCA|nr:LpqN/LpqT family lipoprotein [Nocardia terpenica]KZM68156.1 hypothetical protein AWN90_09450 [Nocardia terpenica]NQE88984.1 hypothetical protein [Nocardia terpenica]
MTTSTGTSAHPLPSVTEYLSAVGVDCTPVQPETPGAPVVSLAVAPGWRKVARDVLPHTYGVWALPPDAPTAEWADNAVVAVGRLSGPVDTVALLRCAFTDSRRMPGWNEISAHTSDYNGYPSAAIVGTYTIETLTFWADTRYIITGTDADRYLIQLTVTTRADTSHAGQLIADALAIHQSATAASHRNTPAQSNTVTDQSMSGRTVQIDGVAVSVDSQGHLQSLRIDPVAFARGPAGLAELISTTYRQAVNSPPPAPPATPKSLQAPGPDDQWAPPTVNAPTTPNIPPQPQRYSAFPIAVSEPASSRPTSSQPTNPYQPEDWTEPDEYYEYKRRTGWFES